jgi:hypothetical protein
MLGALAAVPNAGDVRAAAMMAEDPHVAWGAERRSLMDWLGGDNLGGRDREDTTEGQRMFELEELICRTPATTIAGVGVQAMVTFEFESGVTSYEGEGLTSVVVRNVHATLERLAGGRA